MVSHSLMNKDHTSAHTQGHVYLINSSWGERSSCHIKEKICHVNKQIMWIRACRGSGRTHGGVSPGTEADICLKGVEKTQMK